MFLTRTVWLLILSLITAIATPARAKDHCTISPSERESLLALPYKQFDQEQGSGWRPFYANKCYEEAALLLKEYTKRHPRTAQDNYMLLFHTGQLFALAGKYTVAISWMMKGYSDNNSEQINWNAFVEANIAFLKHDLHKLRKQRNLISQESPMPSAPGVPKWAIGKKMNLDVVDGFIACFGKPYSKAYGDACRQQGKAAAN